MTTQHELAAAHAIGQTKARYCRFIDQKQWHRLPGLFTAVIIVGGNIAHLTRVMTTAIALETSKGDLELALALGIVLITLALTVNAAVMALRLTATRYAYA